MLPAAACMPFMTTDPVMGGEVKESASDRTRHALMMSLISLNVTDWIGIPVFVASVYAISGFFSKSNNSHFNSAVFDGFP